SLYDGNDVAQEMVDGAVTASYLRSLDFDEVFGIRRQDGTYFSIYDGLDSILTFINQVGTSPVQYAYEPFGKTQSTNPAFGNPFQFTGRENDNTALYYFRARYYSPLHQRFLSEDPLRIRERDANLYVYVCNRPTYLTDPTGNVGKPIRLDSQNTARIDKGMVTPEGNITEYPNAHIFNLNPA
ncbi:MAG: RHS repeat-associated core domain-containing protein, partial [Candidatus Binatia bacterium]